MKPAMSLPELDYVKYTLGNGLDVILREDHRLPLVAVNIWYHVGPANERPGRTGFAHLFEHMMFEGSRHVGVKAHFRMLEAAGASEVNGTTDFDRTNYFETLPSNQLELALWLESDRMGFLLEGLDAEKLETQKAIVRNERRQNVESAPYGIVREAVFRQAFPEGHPYHGAIMGSHADIEAAGLDDVRDFFRLYYAPNNASLAIVGDIDPARTRRLVDRYFGPLPAGDPVPPPAAATPPITSERRAVVTDRVELPRVYLVWITDPVFTREDAEFDLIAKILGGGKSSRLYRSLVYERRIAQDVGAHQASLALGSLFHIEATCKPGVAPEEVSEAIGRELAAFEDVGPRPDEIERARVGFESSVIRGLESLGGFGGVADRLNLYNHSLGDPGWLGKDLGRYAAATAGSLRAAARRRLRPQSGIVVYGMPGEKVLDDVPARPRRPASAAAASRSVPGQHWRRTPPRPGPEPPMRLPAAASFRLPNGLTVFWIERRSLPVVSANLIVLGGSECNPPGLPGLASFAAEMLDEGTLGRSPLEIAADRDRIGATLYTGSSMDMAYTALGVLAKNLEPAFELASDILLRPAFAGAEIERVRHDRLTHIQQQTDSPGILATKVFHGAVYGSRHPYGHLEIGTEASNRAVAAGDIAGFYRARYTPSSAALVVSGAVAPEELRALAERYFGGWDGAAGAGADVGPAPQASPRVLVVDRPGASQTVLRVGHAGPRRAHPDQIAIDVMNTILGGLFSSRINRNLRERNGYTYGASSAFVFRRGPGPFIVGTSVDARATAPAVAEIFREIDGMRQGPVTPGELSMAQDAIARSLPGLFETTAIAASSIGQIFLYGLDPDHYRNLPERIRAVTAEDVQRAARRHLDPEKAVVVAVGDRATIESGLESMRHGPVEIRDCNGDPVPR